MADANTDADGYYGEDDGTDEELDLSFLDNEKDETDNKDNKDK